MTTIEELVKKYGCDREKLYNMALSLVSSRLDSHGWDETPVSREDMELIGAVLKDCKLGQQSLKHRVSEIVRQYADKGYNLYQGGCADSNDSKEIEYYWDGFHDCAEALVREIDAVADDCTYEDKVEKVKEDRLAFKALPRLLDMIQPSDRAKYYCGRLADALEREGYTTDAKIVREIFRMMDGERVAMATMDASPSKPSDFEMALAEMADKAQKNVIEPWVVAAQWKDILVSLALKEIPVSRFEAAMHPGDKVIFNEELGCRVNLSQLQRVATRGTIRSEVECLKNELVKNCEGTMFEQGRISALEDILLFIDSMRKEPKELVEDSGELTPSVAKISDQEKPVSADMEAEFLRAAHNLREQPTLSAWFRHFYNLGKRQVMKNLPAKIGIVIGLLSIPVASMTNRFGFGQIPQLLGGIMAIGGALMAFNYEFKHIMFDYK